MEKPPEVHLEEIIIIEGKITRICDSHRNPIRDEKLSRLKKIKSPLFLDIDTPWHCWSSRFFKDLPPSILNHHVRYLKNGYDQFDGEGMTQAIEDLDSKEVYKVEFKNPYWNKTFANYAMENLNMLYSRLQENIKFLFKRFKEIMH